MKIILLDGVGAGFLIYLFGAGLLFIFVAVMLEALVMQWMQYQTPFKKSFLQSLAVNLLSLAGGYVLIETDSDLFQLNNKAGFGLMFVSTLLLETALLYNLNRKKTLKQTIAVCLVMNLVTYFIAFLIIQPFNN